MEGLFAMAALVRSGQTKTNGTTRSSKSSNAMVEEVAEMNEKIRGCRSAMPWPWQQRRPKATDERARTTCRWVSERSGGQTGVTKVQRAMQCRRGGG